MKLIYSVVVLCVFVVALVLILFQHVFPFFGIPIWLGVTLMTAGALVRLNFPSENRQIQLESAILTGRRLDRILEAIEKRSSVEENTPG